MTARILSVICLCFFASFSHAQVPGVVLKKAIQATTPSEHQQNAQVESESDNEKAVAYLRYEDIERLKNPQETMRTFMEAMEHVKKGSLSSRHYFDEAILTLNLSRIEAGSRQTIGKQVAERLISTIDRIAKIDYSLIPTDPAGPKWYFTKENVTEENRSFDVEIAIERNGDGAWRFSPETVASIGKFYSSVAHLKVVPGVIEYTSWKTKLKSYFPDWTSDEFLMFTKGQWLGFVILFGLGLVALSLVRYLTTSYIERMVRKESLDFKEKNHYKSTLPFGLLAFSLIFLAGLRFLELDLETYDLLVRGFYIIIAFASVWSSLKVVDLATIHFKKIAKDTHNKFDDALVPMLSKTSKVLVVAFGTILIAHSLTFDIGSILAGGVAVALAAKDTISNLFGSVTVIMDRPFLIGDYVILDKGLEGTIEEVGFRSTRIRTPHQSLVSLPNNVLANMAIDNFGMRGSRRFKISLLLDYGTPILKAEEFCERLRYSCKIHPMLDPVRVQVYINDLTDSGVSVLFNVFIATQEGDIELQERHKLIVEILSIAKDLNIQFAAATKSILQMGTETTSKGELSQDRPTESGQEKQGSLL
jgi:MscS family membrane protein